MLGVQHVDYRRNILNSGLADSLSSRKLNRKGQQDVAGIQLIDSARKRDVRIGRIAVTYITVRVFVAHHQNSVAYRSMIVSLLKEEFGGLPYKV